MSGRETVAATATVLPIAGTELPPGGSGFLGLASCRPDRAAERTLFAAAAAEAAPVLPEPPPHDDPAALPGPLPAAAAPAPLPARARPRHWGALAGFLLLVAAALRRGDRLSLHPRGRPVPLRDRLLGALRGGRRRRPPAFSGRSPRSAAAERRTRRSSTTTSAARRSSPPSTRGSTSVASGTGPAPAGRTATRSSPSATTRPSRRCTASGCGWSRSPTTPPPASSTSPPAPSHPRTRTPSPRRSSPSSSALVNQLADQAREDAVRFAREELAEAEAHLAEVRGRLADFRRRHSLVDPSADVAGQSGLLNALNAELAQALVDRDVLTSYAAEGDQRVVQADRRIAAITERIEDERATLGVDRGRRVRCPSVVGRYEELLGRPRVRQYRLHPDARRPRRRPRRGAPAVALPRRPRQPDARHNPALPAPLPARRPYRPLPAARLGHRRCSSTTTSAIAAEAGESGLQRPCYSITGCARRSATGPQSGASTVTWPKWPWPTTLAPRSSAPISGRTWWSGGGRCSWRGGGSCRALPARSWCLCGPGTAPAECSSFFQTKSPSRVTYRVVPFWCARDVAGNRVGHPSRGTVSGDRGRMVLIRPVLPPFWQTTPRNATALRKAAS